MMLKEIHDQPTALSNAMSGRISADGSNAELSGFALSPEQIKKLDRINVVACGTAYYASEIICSYIRQFTDLRSEAFIASEFPAKSVCSENTLTIGVSQSGRRKILLMPFSRLKNLEAISVQFAMSSDRQWLDLPETVPICMQVPNML